ncbi:MAG: efflux RND transporter permease subunit, partial [Pseudomonadota bacterium]
QTLQAHHLTLDELAQRIQRESLNATSGELRSGEGIILLKADKQRYFYQDFADIVVAMNPDGSQLRLGDIAVISDSFEETPNVLSRFQGKPAINLEVLVNRDDSIVTIAEEVKALAEEWQNNALLPAGVEIAPWYDRSTNMIERLSLMLKNGAIGILLVMLVLAIFLNLKVAFWVGMGLPVCFAGGLIMMGSGFFDLTLNQITTFGFILVLGILVDDAVVVGESVHTARRQLGDSLESTIIGVKRVAVPTIFGLLTTVAAFFPLSLVAGNLGGLFSQFALVCTACLLFSLVESKLILPAHLGHMNTQRDKTGHLPGRMLASVQKLADRLMDWLKHQVYRPLIAQALHYRYATLGLFLSIFVLVVGLVPSGKVNVSFFPNIPEEVITVAYSVEDGIGYRLAHQQVDRVEAAVDQLNSQWRQQYPGSDEVMVSTFSLVSNDTSGTVIIELSPRENRPISSTEVANKMREVLSQVEGIRELIVATDDADDKDLELSLLSNDPNNLEDATNQVMKALASLEGVRDIHSNLSAGQAQLSFELTPAGRALGMTTESLARQIEQSFFGAEVQRVQRGKDEVKVRVRYPAHQRKDITSLENARVRTPQGDVVSLSTVALVKQERTVTEISRINGYRAATLSANTDETLIDSDEVVEHLETFVFPEISARYPQMQLLTGGDDAEESETAASLQVILIFSLFLIYMLVAVPLKSYWQPLVIMSVIPFGVVGAILGHWVNDMTMNILSINGILALSGVVVNDSLLLVNRYNDLRKSGMDNHQAMVEAGSQRMRAILLTTMTTCLGLLSLLQETSEQAQFLIPAAVSLAYGICFATLMSLILVPVLFSIYDDFVGLFKGNVRVMQARV